MMRRKVFHPEGLYSAKLEAIETVQIQVTFIHFHYIKSRNNNYNDVANFNH